MLVDFALRSDCFAVKIQNQKPLQARLHKGFNLNFKMFEKHHLKANNQWFLFVPFATCCLIIWQRHLTASVTSVVSVAKYFFMRLSAFA